MRIFLIAVMFPILQSSTALNAAERREIQLEVTVLALNASVNIPDEIADPGAVAKELLYHQDLQWSETCRLSTLENSKATFSNGSRQSMVTGSLQAPMGSRPGGFPGRTSPEGSEVPPEIAGVRSGRGGGMRATPTISMEQVGMAVILEPSINKDGDVLMETMIESTRIEKPSDVKDEKEGSQFPESSIRRLSLKSTLLLKPNKVLLVRTSQTDTNGGPAGQIVLIFIKASVTE